MRSVVAVFCIAASSGVEANAQVNVTQEHNNPSRDGVYIDSAFTLACKVTSGSTVTTEIPVRSFTQAAGLTN